MKFENLLIETKEGLATIIIDRPSKLNALNSDTIQELHEAFKKADEDKNIKVIIITGNGDKAFVAGADIVELSKCNNIETEMRQQIRVYMQLEQ